MKLNRHGNVTFFTFEQIQLCHAFSTRTGGVSHGDCASLNLGQHTFDTADHIARNRALLCKAARLPQQRLICMHQVHGSRIATLTQSQDIPSLDERFTGIPETDALITTLPNTTIMAKGADCPTVIVVAPHQSGVAVIHSGWRSTLANIVGKTVSHMSMLLGLSSQTFQAGIGPAICQEHFEVDLATGQLFQQEYPSICKEPVIKPGRPGHSHLNLSGIIEYQLRHAGIEAIEQSDQCTFCCPDWFFSYRRDGATTGRCGLLAAIARK